MHTIVNHNTCSYKNRNVNTIIYIKSYCKYNHIYTHLYIQSLNIMHA